MDSLIFEGLSDDNKKKFLKSFKQKEIKKDEIIKNENEKLEKAFFLIEGEVEVKKEFSGENMQVCNIKAEEDIFFSITCMLDSGKSLTTVVAKKNSVIMEISKKELINFCQINPTVGIKILENINKLLSKIIRKNDNKISKMYNTLEEVL